MESHIIASNLLLNKGFPTVFGCLILAFSNLIFYSACLVIYRIYFGPLSHIPGPKRAIATSWYECYYDVWKRGLYFKKIREFHKTYGPIIRINPHEVHIEDSEFFDELYNNTQKWDKYGLYVQQFNAPTATFSTVKHDLHRTRRKPMNNFFSKRSVVDLEPMLRHHLKKLCAQMETAREAKTPFGVNEALLCYSSDVVSEYAFGKTYGLLDTKDLAHDMMLAAKVAGEGGHTLRQFPWLVHVFDILPNSWMVKLSPGFGLLLGAQELARQQVLRILKSTDTDEEKLPDSIFHALINSDLPAEEKEPERLAKEGWLIAGAGGDTTATTIATLLYHLIANPAALQKLRAELIPLNKETSGSPSWTQLEQLPYLAAVIKEGLRCGHGITARMTRCPADKDLHYKDVVIPCGTPVSMCIPDIHTDPSIFPEPMTFMPERWLQNGSEEEKEHSLRMNRFLVPFAKGSRQCIGMNLALAEIYLVIAELVTRFEFKLYETTREDVDYERDFMLAHPKLGSKYIRVMIE